MTVEDAEKLSEFLERDVNAYQEPFYIIRWVLVILKILVKEMISKGESDGNIQKEG